MYTTAFHDRPLSDYHFLVTGGAGFIGSHIVEYLLQHGAGKVRVLDNLSTGSRSNVELFAGNPRYEFVEGDIRSLDDCRRACEGIQLVSHQAALGSIPRSIADPLTTNDVNLNGFLNILTAARDAGIGRVVYASSSSVYGDDATLPKTESKVGRQISPYAVSKYANELYGFVFGRTYGMKTIGLRYFNVFGPRQRPDGPYAAVIPLFIDTLLRGEAPFINGDGSNSRDFTYVENVVQVNLRALLCENEAAFGQVFNVAVGRQYSLLDLYRALQKLSGSTLEAQFRASRPGDIPHSLADISKAGALLGYRPTVHFEEGLRHTVQFFRQQNPQSAQ